MLSKPADNTILLQMFSISESLAPGGVHSNLNFRINTTSLWAKLYERR